MNQPGQSVGGADASSLLARVLAEDGNLFRYTRHVYLELSNRCNYAHLHKACPVGYLSRNDDVLPDRIVCHVLDTLGRYRFSGRIAFHTYNEPLIDPRLDTFVAHARRACPDSEIYICTNGYYLNAERARALVDAGVTNIHVSAYSDAEYERLSQLVLPIRYAVQRATLDARMDLYEAPPTSCSRPCYSPLYQIIVTAAGRLSLCCYDWKRHCTFGNLHEQSFEEVMKDPSLWTLYEQLSHGQRTLDLCRRCHLLRGPGDEESEDPEASKQTPQMPVAREDRRASLGPQTPFGLRGTPQYDLTDKNAALQRARTLFEQGDVAAAFDLYEQLATACPQQAVPILAEVYDQTRRLRQADRYLLYQSRCFHFGIRPGDKVLDIGSGNVPFHRATHLADLAVDDDQYGRAGVPFKHVEGKPVYRCDIEQLPFGDKEFDFVYCSHVLEHVHHPERACRELMRVARRGYIETPSPAKDLWLDTAAISHHRWAVEVVDGKLVFTEYAPERIRGLQCDIVRRMHCDPQSDREKALSAMVYLKARILNTMLLWDGDFEFEVRRQGSDRSRTLGVGAEMMPAPATPCGESKPAGGQSAPTQEPDECEIAGVSLRVAMEANPGLKTWVERINQAMRQGRHEQAAIWVREHLGHLAKSDLILSRIRPAQRPVRRRPVTPWPVRVERLQMERIGSEYGGWMIDPRLVPQGATILSAGVGEDITFDMGLIAARDCTIIGIDPTPKAVRYVQAHAHPRFHLIAKALAAQGGLRVRMYENANPDHVSESMLASHQAVNTGRFYEADTVSLTELLAAYPDAAVLKMDIEGAEYAVLEAARDLKVPQICVEFHHVCTDHTLEDTLRCVAHLRRMGYLVAHRTDKAGPWHEVTFVHCRCLNRPAVRHRRREPAAVGG